MTQTRKNAIALGFFDGIHLGHQALLERAVLRAGQHGMDPAVFTFDRSPREFVTGIPVPLITGVEERKSIIRSMFPIEKVFVGVFDRAMMTMHWRDYLHMLVEEYGAGWLVAGHDFRFGHKNEGTVELLQAECAAMGLGCDIIPPVTVDGVTVSSTHIRSLLERGDVENATRFLGYPFSLSGTVCHGKGLGSRLGTPTLNVIPAPSQLLPAFGVYVTRVLAAGERFPAVTNVGVRPTVDQQGGVTVESHLLGADRSLYGETCRVDFLRLLREEKRFDTLEELRLQMESDIAQAEAYFGI